VVICGIQVILHPLLAKIQKNKSVTIYKVKNRSEVDEMLRHKAYRFRIYPTKEQEILIAKTIGCSRFVYNHFLHLWNEAYLETGKGLSYHACSASLPKMKTSDETYWLKEVDSIALQSSVKNLADAFTRFFNKQNNYPLFKSKRYPVQSYLTKNVHNSIEVKGK